MAGRAMFFTNVKHWRESSLSGAVAQLGERLLCKQEVTSSILVGSTNVGA